MSAEQRKASLYERFAARSQLDQPLIQKHVQRPLSRAYHSLDTSGGASQVTTEEEKAALQAFQLNREDKAKPKSEHFK